MPYGMPAITIKASDQVRRKLEDKHQVSMEEVMQCFYNREYDFVEDTREDHRTDPPTQWFIAETDTGHCLKVIFVMVENQIHIKSAYQPNDKTQRLYKALLGKQIS